MKKRLFIGTFIDTTLMQFIYDEIKNDFNKVCTGKWVELENLHFTFKFLGHVDEELIPELKDALKNYLKQFDSILQFKKFGVFPNTKKPNVLFCKTFNPDKIIFTAQKEMDEILTQFRFEKEKRKFLPHLTLLRIKKTEKNFPNILSFYYDYEIGSMLNFSINLIESKLNHKGPTYKII